MECTGPLRLVLGGHSRGPWEDSGAGAHVVCSRQQERGTQVREPSEKAKQDMFYFAYLRLAVAGRSEAKRLASVRLRSPISSAGGAEQCSALQVKRHSPGAVRELLHPSTRYNEVRNWKTSNRVERGKQWNIQRPTSK